MTSFDMSEKFREPFIVILHFWRPIYLGGGIGVISKSSKKTMEKTWATVDESTFAPLGL
jgi:hypothetical protein